MDLTVQQLQMQHFSQNRPGRSQFDQIRVRDAVRSAGPESGLNLIFDLSFT